MKSAIIGLGVIGRVHARVLSSQENEIVALCDVDVAAAEKIKNEFAPCAEIYTDWIKMLDEVKPDVVHICTPHYLHADMVVGALDRDINVLCEKPLCIKHEDIGRILDAETRSAAQLGVCQQNRYLESMLMVKEYIADKEIVGAHGSVVWTRGEDYYNSAEWRGTKAQEGGGVLINQALHTLDLVQWFCGEPDEVVSSNNNYTLKGVIEVEDTLAARFYGKNSFTFFATNSAPCDFPIRIDIALSNKDKIAVYPNMLMINGEVRLQSKQSKVLGKACYGNGHEALIADFYDCIATGRPFAIDGKEGAKVVRMILAAYKSNGEKIAVN